MTILITGASGLIGSYLCGFFSAAGHTIIAAARDINKIPDIKGPGFHKVHMDVLTADSVSLTSIPHPDTVIHTATSNDIISKKTADGILLSTIGTKNILDLCVNNKIPQIIFFSTFQVYGVDLEGKVNETTLPRCNSDYGLNHIFGEQYVEMYTREKGLNGIIVRPSNVYGKFSTKFVDRWTLVPGCFCREIVETGQITLRSSGLQTRNFVNLENIGRALTSIMEAHTVGYDIYNIASTLNYSIAGVAGMVKNIYEKKYNKQGAIKILANTPSTANSFTVDLQKLIDIGFTEEKYATMATAIEDLFIYIEKQKHEPSSAI